MKNELLMDVITNIDEELLNPALRLRAERLARGRGKRAALRKPLAAAVCAAIVLGMTLPGVGYLQNRIPLTSAVGDVSVRYVTGKRIPLSQACYAWLSEQEIFDAAELVFSGEVTEIRHIKLNFDGVVDYRSLITIRIDRFLRGQMKQETVTVLAEAQGNRTSTSSGNLLNTLKTGDYGIFLTNIAEEGQLYSQNGCSVDISELCDATFGDSIRFGFIREEGGDTRCDDTYPHTAADRSSKTFPSLTAYDWDSVVAYVERMLASL